MVTLQHSIFLYPYILGKFRDLQHSTFNFHLFSGETITSYKSICSRTGQSGELLRIVLITEQTRNKDNYTQAWLLFAVFLDRAITTVLTIPVKVMTHQHKAAGLSSSLARGEGGEVPTAAAAQS